MPDPAALPRPSALFDLGGQVALVTGSSRGLGWAMARALAGAGTRVVLNGRDPASLAARQAEIAAAGGAAEIAAFDIGEAEAASAAIRDIGARHGRLDILVSNATGSLRKPALEHSDAEWARAIEMGLNAGFRLAREAARLMVPAGYGRLIFTSSINATVVRPGMVGYAAAKTGLFGLVRALAVELAPRGVTVNALAPGYFLTDGNAPTRRADPTFEARIAARTPMGRWGAPEELGPAILFLASRASGFATGSVVTVDGGLTVAI